VEDGIVTVTIECARGQTVRTRIDRGSPEVVRPLPDGVAYPANYGYATGTRADDGEPIDVFVLGEPRAPLTVVTARVVGAVEFWDARGADEKLVAVPCGPAREPDDTTGVTSDAPDPAWADDVAAIAAFLVAYKPPEKPHRVGRVLGPTAARALLAKARRRARDASVTDEQGVKGGLDGSGPVQGGATRGSMA